MGHYTETRHIKCRMKAPWMDPGLRELAALSAWLRLVVVLPRGRVIFCSSFSLAPPVQLQLSRRYYVCGEIIGRVESRIATAPCLICAVG